MTEIIALAIANPISVAIIAIALGGVGSGVYNLIDRWFQRRHEYNLKSLETRKLEALAKMGDKERELLLEQMPEWIDRNDPKEVEAFKQARREAVSR